MVNLIQNGEETKMIRKIQDDKKSTIGYLFMNGASPNSWSFKMQGIMALPSCEIEYIATLYAACQALWMEMLLEKFI